MKIRVSHGDVFGLCGSDYVFERMGGHCYIGFSITQVDTFTDQPFSGNPATVCVLPEPRDDQWMQDVAREMNLSETAFLLKCDDGFWLRWFTPTVEVELCGHATLASAHVLWEEGHVSTVERIHFYTQSGTLTADRRDTWIELDFPAEPEVMVTPPPGLIDALGIEAVYVGKNRSNYLVQARSEEVVRKLNPNVSLLSKITTFGTIVTSLSSSHGYDFISRFFAPALGMDEDPVTGSSHCCLGPFWSSRLNKSELMAYQASARGGTVRFAFVLGESVCKFLGRPLS